MRAQSRFVIMAMARPSSSIRSRPSAFQGVGLNGTAKVYRLTAESSSPVYVGQVPASGSTFPLTLPPMTVSTIDVR